MPAGAARPALGRQATWLPSGLKLNLQASRVDSIRYSSCLGKSRQSNPHNSAPDGAATPHSSVSRVMPLPTGATFPVGVQVVGILPAETEERGATWS